MQVIYTDIHVHTRLICMQVYICRQMSMSAAGNVDMHIQFQVQGRSIKSHYLYMQVINADIYISSSGSRGGFRGFNPPFRGVFFFACQYMKIPTDLDPKPPLRRILAQNPPPLKEFLDPPLISIHAYTISGLESQYKVALSMQV